MPRRPGYTEDANDAVTAIRNKIEGDVRFIAERLAKHEGTEKILRAHVETAYSALSHLGLKRTRFYRRTEFEAILGGICWTAASQCQTFLHYLFPGRDISAFNLVAVAALAVAGTLLCLNALERGMV